LVVRLFKKVFWRIAPPAIVASAITVALSAFGAFAASRQGTAVQRVPHRAAHISPSSQSGWVGTWDGSPQAPCSCGFGEPTQAVTGVTNQTVRNIVYAAIGGSKVRVRFSNLYGQQPLVIGSASIGIELLGAQVVPGTMHALTFDGKPSVTIPVGQEIASDPLPFDFAGEQNLVISEFLPGPTGPTTFHLSAKQNNYVSTSGDFSQDPSATAYTTTISSWLIMDGVDVIPSNHNVIGSVVAFGDSITDTGVAMQNVNDRWPNILGDRLAQLNGPTLSVVDAGIGGNRVVSGSPCFGDSAPDRFTRDVIDQPGVRDVIVLEGVNDLGFSEFDLNRFGAVHAPCFEPNTNVSAQQIIDGYEQLIAMAHAHGLKIFGATITPFKGTYYWDQAAEQKRETINNWIRTSGAFDGVVDFDQVVRDPYDPQLMNPQDTSASDMTLHPGDLGLIAMGDSINLRMLLK
jgi:lysophospholipase L1-like esterase